MWPVTRYFDFRADALFVSPLQRSDQPGPEMVRQAIAAAIRLFGGPGCAERVAQEFGDHPEMAVIRMRWVRAAIPEAFADMGGGPVWSPGSMLRAS